MHEVIGNRNLIQDELEQQNTYFLLKSISDSTEKIKCWLSDAAIKHPPDNLSAASD